MASERITGDALPVLIAGPVPSPPGTVPWVILFALFGMWFLWYIILPWRRSRNGDEEMTS